jgi:hypothetical protein
MVVYVVWRLFLFLVSTARLFLAKYLYMSKGRKCREDGG